MRGDGDVGESAVAVVLVEDVGQAVEVVGGAVGGDLVDAALGGGFEVVVEVVDDQEVEQAIVVVIEPAGGDAPGFADGGDVPGDMGLDGDVGEGAVAIVVEELVVIDAGDVEVDESVVVVVSGGDAHGVAEAGEAGLRGDVGEGSVAVVVEEAVVEGGIGFVERWDLGAVGEEEVEQTVVVVVEGGDSAGHGFDGVAVRAGAAVEGEGDFRLLDDVVEGDG